MPVFKNLKDVERYYNRQQNSKLIGDIDIVKVLENEANRLADLLEEEIWKAMNLYEPKFYQRTYQLVSSIRVSPIQSENGLWKIKIYFDPEYAYHPSIIDDNKYDMGYTPVLYDRGWKWQNYFGKEDRFRYFKGSNFISNAINEWKKTSNKFIQVKVEYPDEPYF